MNVLRKEKFIFVETNENHNKVWYIEELDNSSIKTTWGRVGNTLTESVKSFDYQEKAAKEYDKLVKTKTKKGYTKLRTIDGSEGIVNVSIQDIALTDIDFDNSYTDISDMIKFFCAENIHNIVSNTNITFNTDKNIFTTPVGVVTIDAVNDAKSILTDITNFIINNNFNDEFVKSVEKYCSIIPQKVSRKFNPKEIFSSKNEINKQNDILDSLIDSIKTITELNKDPKQREKIFNTSISKVTDKKELDELYHLFKSTHNKMHSCRNLKMKNVYAINIKFMKDRFDNTESNWSIQNKNKNKKLLWHGTKSHNIISIMKNGLVVPNAFASYCTGRMFGNCGPYLSDQSTKSLNYSYGYWDSNRSSHCYMFLCDVLCGNQYIPKHPGNYDNMIDNKKFDSIFAKANYSGVMNNEMVVPVSQINIKYLIEFGE